MTAQIQLSRKSAVRAFCCSEKSFTPDGLYDSSLDSCGVHRKCCARTDTEDHFTIGSSGRARICPPGCFSRLVPDKPSILMQFTKEEDKSHFALVPLGTTLSVPQDSGLAFSSRASVKSVF